MLVTQHSSTLPLICVAALSLNCTIQVDDGARADEPTSSAATRVVFLGTGTPNADPDRSGPAVAVVSGGSSYLIDAGPGIVRRAAAAAREGIPELEPQNLKTAFVTHLHSDHTVGLPDLILSPWVLEREVPLELYGPPGIAQMAEHILAAYNEDINVRIQGLQPTTPDGFRVNAHEVSPGEVYRDSNVTVTAFRVDHGSWDHSFGYKFEARDRTIVVSGDASPSPAIAENCAQCDVLVHEVYSAAGFQRRPPEWQRYHADAHTSTAELAEIATVAQPRLLIVYHQLFWGSTPEDLLEEIAKGYDGPVVSASDLDVY